MRTLAIDFGERRIGVAVSDPEGRVAVPLTTLTRKTDRAALRQIAALVTRESVEALVVGDPVRLDGSRGEASERVRRFAAKLADATGIEPVFVPETLTTAAARERLRAAGVDVRKHPERLDATAAQILLEEALEALARLEARERPEAPARQTEPDSKEALA